MQFTELHSSDTSIPILTGPTPFTGSSSLPPLPDSVFASEDPVLNLPKSSILENTSFLPSFQINSEVHKSNNALSLLSSQPDAESHYIHNASFELSSCSSSPFPENLSLSPLNLLGDLASFDVGQGIWQDPIVMNWDLVAWAALIGGPLGEVLANNINMPSEENGQLSVLKPHNWRMGLESSVLINFH